MDKQQAQNIIKETFECPFDKSRFTEFIRNLLNRIDESKAFHARGDVKEMFRHVIKTYERIGTYNSPEGEKIDIIITYLQKGYSLDHARVTQRNFAGRYLVDRGEKDAGIFAFVSPDNEDWRFSLVKMDYKFEKTKSGRMKVKEEFTPARRWSFLVGKNEKSHTAQIRLVNILKNDEQNPTLEEIEKAFDIETVTKEFFLEYRGLFLRTKDELDKVVTQASSLKNEFESKGVDTVNFAKKLLGQIVFLYFLQKKGWFGVGRDDDWGTGSKHFLRELFEKKVTHASSLRNNNHKQDACDTINFFNDILEPLFYEALRIDRSHDDGYYSRFNCKIPFLNGGLFDPIGNYDWVHTDIIIPDKLFSNKIINKKGDKGTGILDVFDRYNFTVKEDEPLEKEVAIDPELLGKAYEKFNAIRPDNYAEFRKALKSGKKGEENKFNKKFGVYYTPREIVHYMCQQSLINYLYTVTQASSLRKEKEKNHKQDACVTIAKEDLEALIHTGEQLSENEATALLKARMIAEGKQKTTKNKPVLPESIEKNAAMIDEKLADITVCDPAVGSGAFPVGMMSEIVKARNVLSVFLPKVTQASRVTQASSLSTINTNHKQDACDTYNFKRHCIEHSLYGVDIDPGAVEIAKLRLWLSLVVDEDDIKNIKPLPNLDYKVVCGNSLLGVEKNLFNLNSFNELEKLKPLFFNETNPTKKQGYRAKIDDLISKITNGHREFDFEIYFSEVFHKKSGFDVVIANPPYGADIPKEQLKQIKKQTKDTNNSNSAAIFIDFAKNRFIHQRGVLTFIVPKSLLYSEKWFSLVESLSTKTSVLVDVEKGFENVLLEQVVFVYNRYQSVTEYQALKFDKSIFVEKATIPLSSIKQYKVWLCDVSEKEIKIAEKMTKKSLFLSEFSNTTRGLPLQSKLKKNSDIPVIGGKDIQRYAVIGTKGFLSNTILYSSQKAKLLLQPKIISQRIVAHIQNPTPYIQIISTVDIEGNILSVDTFLKSQEYSLMFIVALLNSKLINWYAYRFIFGSAIRTMDLDDYYIGKIPVYKTSQTAQNAFSSIVKKINAIKNSEDYFQNTQKQAKVKVLEAEINQLVYKLYGLTPEEIKIVEGEK